MILVGHVASVGQVMSRVSLFECTLHDPQLVLARPVSRISRTSQVTRAKSISRELGQSLCCAKICPTPCAMLVGLCWAWLGVSAGCGVG